MACTPQRARQLGELVAGTLEPEVAEELVEHAAGCPVCASVLSRGGATGTRAVSGRPLARLLPIAVGLALVATMLFLVFRGTLPREPRGALARLATVERPAIPEDTSPELRLALAPFEAGDWEAAARALEARLEAAPGDARAAVFLGVARLELGEAERAALALRRAWVSDDRWAKNAAQWYLAHALLALEKGRVALHHLEQLARRGGPFATRAPAKIEAVRAALDKGP